MSQSQVDTLTTVLTVSIPSVHSLHPLVTISRNDWQSCLLMVYPDLHFLQITNQLLYLL
ncbi:MAG: hypothetical protein ACK56F_21015 [bacterium]